MAEVTITVRRKGSLKVEGPFRLIDSEGNDIPLPTNKPAVSLCRCGHSRNKPFCDSSHRDCGWDAPEAHILAREKQEKEKLAAGGSA
ncbi:MAG TPA: CDGSH iron-sulfur domain-containing protein [Terriglobales bacterium]|nr:CDGSH iron-sulfur domain-containing protein [Terriglobales bacterium]